MTWTCVIPLWTFGTWALGMQAPHIRSNAMATPNGSEQLTGGWSCGQQLLFPQGTAVFATDSM